MWSYVPFTVVFILFLFFYITGLVQEKRSKVGNISYKQYKMPDLRVSDDAPDWYSATVAKNSHDEETPLRMMREHAESRAKMYREYNETMARHIENQKIRRWKEGRPVTKEDPL